uniref:Methyltransferase domain-containing protein n=1 Tax=Rhodosorus marinus TaxID=101924 RepID=A0A7S0BHK7_9RHOD|mmetsp:Transcript_16806/g.24175  ORF Transcript_16806/g.24175 Transcript_16806/m.24175 type:complete len:214 (+) Transcript_16806:164-805(+)
MEPDDNTDYKKKEYWDNRFDSEKNYDWLVSFPDVEDIIRMYVKPTDRILIVGCGNSEFSFQLYEAGFRNITSIDYSDVVISKMKEQYQQTPELTWTIADVRELSESFDAASFDVVIDKATMDALVVDQGSPWIPSQPAIDDVFKMCKEMIFVLRPGGMFIQITFQELLFRRRFLEGYHISSTEQSGPLQWKLKESHRVPVGLGYQFIVMQTLM